MAANAHDQRLSGVDENSQSGPSFPESDPSLKDVEGLHMPTLRLRSMPTNCPTIQINRTYDCITSMTSRNTTLSKNLDYPPALTRRKLSNPAPWLQTVSFPRATSLLCAVTVKMTLRFLNQEEVFSAQSRLLLGAMSSCQSILSSVRRLWSATVSCAPIHP